MSTEDIPSEPTPEGAPSPEPAPEGPPPADPSGPRSELMPDELLDRRLHEIVERMKVMTLGAVKERLQENIEIYDEMVGTPENGEAAPPTSNPPAEPGSRISEEGEEIPFDYSLDEAQADDHARLAFLGSVLPGDIGTRVERERREGKDSLALGAAMLDIVHTLAELHEITQELDERRARSGTDISRIPETAADADPHLARRLAESRVTFRALAARNPGLAAMAQALPFRAWIAKRESSRRQQWDVVARLEKAPRPQYVERITQEMKVYDRFLSGSARSGDGVLLQGILEEEMRENFELDEMAFVDALRGDERVVTLGRRVQGFAELDRVHELAGAFDRSREGN